MSTTPNQPYDALASVYDVVMQHVDYEDWATFALELISQHAPHARSVLELGCGTGSLAIEMQLLADEVLGLDGGFDYLATDGSEAMLRVAEAKIEMQPRGRKPDLALMDFTTIEIDRRFDVVLLLYDGLNYLLEEDRVRALFDGIAPLLGPTSIAIVDQSTPANSINNAHYFGDEGEAGGIAYVRRSRYDAERHLHLTEFEIEADGRRFHETHLQRAYWITEMRAIIAESSLAEVAAYDGFTQNPATVASERIHWVLRAR